MKNNRKNNEHLVHKTKNSRTKILRLSDNTQQQTSLEYGHLYDLDLGFYGIRSVNVTSDNRYLIITFEDSDGMIRVLDLKNLEFLPYEYAGHSESVRLTSITKDNKAFYTASWDGTSRRFDIISGQCTKTFSGFGRSPSCFLSPNQKYLFTVSYDSDYDLKSKNTGRCWDILSGKIIGRYKHMGSRIRPESIDIAYENGIVYTGSDDGIAYKWNLAGDKPILKFFEFEGSVRKVAISRNYFAAACTDGLVRLHNKFSGKCIRNILHKTNDIREVRISQDESKLWSAAEDGAVYCFNLNTGDMIFRRKIHSYWIWSICLMNDEKILVTGSSDGSVVFLDATSGEVLAMVLNAHRKNETLISCTRDKNFPTGFFYTTNKDRIQVITLDKKNRKYKKLKLNDPRRNEYINKLNLKNLVITRLKMNGQYSFLTDKYIQNKNLLRETKDLYSPHLLTT